AIYIQGDKKTPIYVKVEGMMMPRLGMNYCIIPNLEPGIAEFEILFQGNQYPTQKFKIRIPEQTTRGFILTQIDQKNFALYDIQSNAYINNNNQTDEAFIAIAPSSNSVHHLHKSQSIKNNAPSTNSISIPELPKIAAPISTTPTHQETNNNR